MGIVPPWNDCTNLSMASLNEPPDSAKLYIVNAKDPGEPRQLTSGIRAAWIGSDRLGVTKVKQTGALEFMNHDELVGVDGTLVTAHLKDSVSVVREIAGNKLLLLDWHQPWPEFLVASTEYLNDPSKISSRKLKVPGVLVIPGRQSLYALDRRNRLLKIDYATGRQQQVSGNFPALSVRSSAIATARVSTSGPYWDIASSISVSDDGSKLAFVSFRYSGKLVMIENIFK